MPWRIRAYFAALSQAWRPSDTRRPRARFKGALDFAVMPIFGANVVGPRLNNTQIRAGSRALPEIRAMSLPAATVEGMTRCCVSPYEGSAATAATDWGVQIKMGSHSMTPSYFQPFIRGIARWALIAAPMLLAAHAMGADISGSGGPAEGANGGLEEIVVTAQRRE